MKKVIGFVKTVAIGGIVVLPLIVYIVTVGTPNENTKDIGMVILGTVWVVLWTYILGEEIKDLFK
ncbi:MAG: hypothetical protein L0I72_10410 [Tetragenococcus halophilus]|nr:hypothetical protein [Tetragenococcus halophilus]